MADIDSTEDEFQTVELLKESDTKTGRTDAFIISWVKAEKQVRKIFTYLIFQYKAFNMKHVQDIIKIISSKNYLYFENFIKGFDAIYPIPFKNIVKPHIFDSFLQDKRRIKKFRNKILHGQLTGEGLSSDNLKYEIHVIREWCKNVGNKMINEIHYNGFDRNSFRKCYKVNLSSKYKIELHNSNELEDFIKSRMR